MTRFAAILAGCLSAGSAAAQSPLWDYTQLPNGAYEVRAASAGQVFVANDLAEHPLGAIAFLRVLPDQYELTLAIRAEPFAAARVRGQHDCDRLSLAASEPLSPGVSTSTVRMTCLRNGTERPVVVNLNTLHPLPWATDR